MSEVDGKLLLNRFPKFELSYETISHKKVSLPYDVALAIPMGRKYYAWFTFEGKQNVCYLMEITRDKRFGKITKIDISFHHSIALGTIFYGTIVPQSSDMPDNAEQRVFLIEDIFYYKGVSIKHHTFCEKMGVIQNVFLEEMIVPSSIFAFSLPVLWSVVNTNENVESVNIKNCGYTVHHVQYRSFNQIVPYINMSAKPKPLLNTGSERTVECNYMYYGPVPDFNYSKPQYKYPTTFIIKADIQFDIYHLFAYGQNKMKIYCGVAGIPDYKNSIFMNGLFRNIRENKNLDYIEESDDEDDFENTQIDKYVDHEKELMVECTFHKRFKKWVPIKLAPGQMIVHIHKL